MNQPIPANPVSEINEESFALLLDEVEQSRDIREGTVLDALVVECDGNRVSLDAGLKSQSIISADEFRSDEGKVEIKAGEFVKVRVEMLDDGRGNTRLSHLQYRRELAWKKLVEAQQNNEIIEGYVHERVKGGYSVHIDGLRAFLPGSLTDLFPVKEGDLVGRRERFYVERLKEDRKSAILNRRLVRERELLGADLSKLNLNVGDVFDGKVAAIVDYPDYVAFVNIGEGVHGRLPRSEVSWLRINSIGEVLAIGDEVKVAVLDVDIPNKLIMLSARQLKEDPWKQVEVTYPVGARIWGKVTSLQEYGAFVELEPGIGGLVHTSEMDWLDGNVDPNKVVTVGEEVEVMMLGCDMTKRRISLGLKQCRPNPWEEFGVTYRKGTRLKGKISGVEEKFGLFVDVTGGLRGLVHTTDLSYTAPGKQEVNKYHIGQEIDVILLGVDQSKKRISLGVKQLGADPYEELRGKLNRNEIVTAKVKRVVEKGAQVTLLDGLDGFIPIGEICVERIDTAADRLKEGQEVEAVILDLDRRKGSDKLSVILSIKQKDSVSEKRAVAEHRASENAEAKQRSKQTAFGSMVKSTLGMADDAASGAPAEPTEAVASEDAAAGQTDTTAGEQTSD